MPSKIIKALFVFVLLIQSCKNETLEFPISKVIPAPMSHTYSDAFFTFDQDLIIEKHQQFPLSGNFLEAFFQNNGSILINESVDSPKIQFILDETIENEEGYILDIQKDLITINAKEDAGAFYAVQTLRQLLPEGFEGDDQNMVKTSIRSQRIEDAPRFKYRGMHLDVGRHMYSTDFIKKYIDAIAMLKMNTFHWHLTEDQGWRIEIKKYPKLNEVAAYRNETLIGHYNDQPQQFDGKRYGGYYSQEEIKELVAYAQARHVTIIPEIEMPGHSQAAIAAYPELGCSGEQVEVATKWGVFEDIYCTKDETFDFLEDVLDEVIELFPSEYIHIGGDEAPKTRWKACAECQRRIQSEGLKDEHELQNYFITRIERYLNSKGRQIIGWDEILEGGLAPNATVMSWRGINGAIEAAKKGHNVVMTPTSHCYFDYYQSEGDNEPLAIGGFLPLEKVYSFEPIPKELTAEQSKHVLGAQANMWTEYMPTSDQVEYMLFPRILAISEVGWTTKANKNYEAFVPRVEQFVNRLELLDFNYANHLYEVEEQLNFSEGKISYGLSTLTEGKDIRYTLNGDEPTANSELYETPLLIDSTVLVQSAVFKDNERLGSILEKKFNFHKGVGQKISLNVEPHPSYNSGGIEALINSVKGSDTRYGDKEWLGFWGEDVEITIDLSEMTHIESISTRFHNGKGQWIYAPKQMLLFLDDNQVILEEIFPRETTHANVNVPVNQTAKKIRISIPNYGIIPEGVQGAGNKAWTFIDEIRIN